MADKVIQLKLGENAQQLVQRLQDDLGCTSLSHVVREALTLYDWAREQVIDHGLCIGAFTPDDREVLKEAVILHVKAETEGEDDAANA